MELSKERFKRLQCLSQEDLRTEGTKESNKATDKIGQSRKTNALNMVEKGRAKKTAMLKARRQAD